MKRFNRVMVAVSLALLLSLGVIAVPASRAAPGPEPLAPAIPAPHAPHLVPESLRRISIPFGVENALELANGGREIRVVGHAECPAEMERFSVRAIAVQDGPGSYGTGTLTGELSCQPGEQSWELLITAHDGSQFVEGAAWVCVTSIFVPAYGETGLFRWCYEEVTLAAAPPAEDDEVMLPLILSVVEQLSALWRWFPF